MRQVIFILALVVLALGLVACSGSGTPATPTAAAQAKPTPRNVVTAEGTVLPTPRATLAFKMGGRVAEILVHEGDAVKSGATLARLDDTALKSQVAQTQAALNVAQKQLAQLKAGASAAERQSAKQALDAARANLAKVKAGPTADQLAQLKANVDSAQAALAQAQTAYDRAGGASNPYIGMTGESLALQQATNALHAAQAALRDAQSHPTDSELQAAQSAVSQAESAVARLDPTPESVALAEAQVAQAQAALDAAKTSLQDTMLTAPFDGTVASVAVDLGQVVGAGTPAFTFGNLAKLQVETTDLVEVDVARIAVGQPVNVKADALAEQVFQGKVVSIAPMANDYRGDKVYKVTIELPDGAKAGLRWGMTANVEIAAK